MHYANPALSGLGMLGKGQAALEFQAPSPAKRKGERAFPRSTVTLEDELSLRALCQALLRPALVTVNKGHMPIWGQCVTSTAVFGYLVTINQGHSHDLHVGTLSPAAGI